MDVLNNETYTRVKSILFEAYLLSVNGVGKVIFSLNLSLCTCEVGIMITIWRVWGRIRWENVSWNTWNTVDSPYIDFLSPSMTAFTSEILWVKSSLQCSLQIVSIWQHYFGYQYIAKNQPSYQCLWIYHTGYTLSL